MKKEQKCLPEERCKKADEKVFVFKSEQAQILNVDPDAVAHPVTVEEKKGLSRDSSNVPPFSAEYETYESRNDLKNHKTQKLAEGIQILGMIRGIRFDHLYSDIPAAVPHQRPISHRERVTFQRSSSFSWESIPGWTPGADVLREVNL
ncbi:hypothetical protein TNCV_1768881 [Trichonephila clavipes]|nr:hypothetical protein TNCV_1768881 [Trichonephila clavipes]